MSNGRVILASQRSGIAMCRWAGTAAEGPPNGTWYERTGTFTAWTGGSGVFGQTGQITFPPTTARIPAVGEWVDVYCGGVNRIHMRVTGSGYDNSTPPNPVITVADFYYIYGSSTDPKTGGNGNIVVGYQAVVRWDEVQGTANADGTISLLSLGNDFQEGDKVTINWDYNVPDGAQGHRTHDTVVVATPFSLVIARTTGAGDSAWPGDHTHVVVRLIDRRGFAVTDPMAGPGRVATWNVDGTYGQYVRMATLPNPITAGMPVHVAWRDAAGMHLFQNLICVRADADDPHVTVLDLKQASCLVASGESLPGNGSAVWVHWGPILRPVMISYLAGASVGPGALFGIRLAGTTPTPLEPTGTNYLGEAWPVSTVWGAYS